MRQCLTAQQNAALTSVTARRFVRARKCNGAKAAKMYSDYLAWRVKESVDDVLSEPAHAEAIEAALKECFNPRMLPTLDRRSRPVLFMQIGKVDMASLRKQGCTMQLCVRRYVRELEKLQKAVEEAAPFPERGQLSLVDIAGCTPRKFLANLRLLMELAKIGNLYYPELMGGLCIVRGPPAAAWSVRVAKRFVDPETGSKIELWSPADTPQAVIAHLGEAEDAMPPELLCKV